MKKSILYVILALSMGAIYYGIEILFRGYSHWTMVLTGMLCGGLIDLINEHKLTWNMPLWKQVLWGEAIVLPLEFIVGCIVNIWLKWNVWDYSMLAFNILGQSSPLFALIFVPVILFAIFYGDYFRYFFMGEEKPRYTLFRKK
jgi:uncharacterized membrane protein